ncbi:MAG: bifunctional UDP-N-acetylglucosamine diphosphorylase/glucosamine-1-phosphate N-acetyltransferase GlmU [Firmicutes bacterium]|nr:bifunctional UDP-N-acetylglucosamine diphosphorylase/glucosamine-1-phosphate N-acetyltransferase GlmU [Bacillota bacterium]
MTDVTAVILAAGHGTRMKSKLVKVLHPVGGKPMVGHVVENCRQAGIGRIVVVVGVQQERVRAYLGDTVEYAVQDPQLGTAHAVMQAEPLLRSAAGDLLVINGDTPLLRPETIRRFVQAHRESGAHASLLTAVVEEPGMMGRILRDGAGRLVRVVEYKDATPEQRQIREVNGGVYCFRLEHFWEYLHKVDNNNAQKEYYLPDVFDRMQAAGLPVQAVPVATAEDVLAPNDRKELARAEAILRQRILDRLMAEGVTIVDPATTWVSAEARVERDTVIYPFTFIEGRSVIGEGCHIGPGTRIVNCEVGPETRIEMSVVEESRIGPRVRIGPFAHVRPGCDLGPGVELGNFAEIKKTRLGAGVKMHHHGYLGDSEVGEGANIGAGVITSNYDGYNKHRTIIGPGAFIGTNVNLVAPVTIGKDSYVAAGSTINRDVPENALAIARARQENKPGYAEILRARARARKEQQGQQD